MLTKPQVFYDNNLKQALGFQNPFYLKKAQQIRPMLYDGSVIAKETNVISIADSEETLMLEEESRSKMVLKQRKGFCHTSIKNDLRKLKRKDIVDNDAQVSNATTIAPGLYKFDPVTLAPKDKNNREAHIYYLKHIMEQDTIFREIVEQAKSLNPLDSASYSACKYVKLIQELLGYVRDTCPDIHKPSEKLVAITPINKKKIVSYMFDARHELCFFEFVSDMNAILKSKSVKKAKKKEEWKPTRKVVQIILWYLDSGCSKHMTGDRSQLTNFVHKFLSTIKFGLGHNLFSVGQFCDSDLEVAFRKHTCFVRNLEGVDLLSGSWKTNLYTLSIGDMMASSPICLLSKASKTKS
ncbi:hypothetical protein Tco_0047329 [Tanacetum coccineum]